MNKKNSKNVSLDESIGFDKEGNEINLLDIIESSDVDIVEDIELKNNIRILYSLVNEVLTEREKQIII